MTHALKVACLVLGALVATVPSMASAQALDTAASTQALRDLTVELRGSTALQLIRDIARCKPVDADQVAEGLAELNGLDQRATSLANVSSGPAHARVMTLVRDIESEYDQLLYPTPPDRCYVAPAA